MRDPAQVAAAVAAALGVREQPGVPAAEALARVLARQQLLLVLDNCEHVIGAAAQLCAGLLAACDDVRVLATSREPLAVAGEARYRLAPLSLPGPEDQAGAGGSEAVALFADRARRADARFTLDRDSGPAVAQIVARLDGMPLAIELAAARVEALGVAQLLDRLDDRFALLAGGDRLAAGRHRSLAATVEWSYQLLDDHERRVFRWLSVFPGPFTLEAAEAVAGAGAGPAVLHLVDCSLLSPPQAGPDGRSRYHDAGDPARLRGRAAGRGRGARRGRRRAGQVRAAGGRAGRRGAADQHRRGDGGRAVAGRRGCHHAAGAGLGDGPRPGYRGAAGGRAGLVVAAARPAPGPVRAAARGRRTRRGGQRRTGAPCSCGPSWPRCSAPTWPGRWMPPPRCGTRPQAGGRPGRWLDGLAGRAAALVNLGRAAEAAGEARRSLAVAREIGYPAGEILALGQLSFAAWASDDLDGAVQLARQAAQITAGVPGSIVRWSSYVLTGALIAAGDMAAADEVCAAGLARSREAGDVFNQWGLLPHMVILDLHAGRVQDAAAHLREGIQIAVRTGGWIELVNCLDCCGYLCAATGRPAEAVTMWAACDTLSGNDASARRRAPPGRAPARRPAGART